MSKNKIRPRKDDDKDNVDKAIKLIDELMKFNDHIEPTLWVSALYFVIASGYKECGFSHPEFKMEMNEAFDHYKDFFDANN